MNQKLSERTKQKFKNKQIKMWVGSKLKEDNRISELDSLVAFMQSEQQRQNR